MNKIKVIKTEKDYKDALELVEVLMCQDVIPESDEEEQLELLAKLIYDYESKEFPETFPSPVDAIKFRMDQCDLKQSDLVPYIGSKSRVSEVLSGKRQLTLNMIRDLESGLGIPAKVLIRKSEIENNVENYSNWDNRIISEMKNNGYFDDYPSYQSKEDLLSMFFSSSNKGNSCVMLRSVYRLSSAINERALRAWITKVVKNSQRIDAPKYKKDGITLDFMKNLIKLSAEEDGVLIAQEYLRSNGIILVIEPHLTGTYLDGATILNGEECPVIGLTLRHDRLDNFWFTLMHEIAHIFLHSNKDIDIFYDEIDGKTVDGIEKEADNLAGEIILPGQKWEISPARIVPSLMAARSLALELGVHVSLIAGQIRHRGNNYTYLSNIIKESKVRECFLNKKWKK
jgi:HTH-type transcriptional regulator/antitoxin HigA